MGTFSEPMRNVTGEESEPVIDIWPYAEKVFARELPEDSADDAEVSYVYLSGDGGITIMSAFGMGSRTSTWLWW